MRSCRKRSIDLIHPFRRSSFGAHILRPLGETGTQMHS